MQEARNCCGKYPISGYKLQLANRSVINECPNSYFELAVIHFYEQYSNYITMKNLGIMHTSKDLTLLELEAYSIIERESAKAIEEYDKKKRKREGNLGKNHGR